MTSTIFMDKAAQTSRKATFFTLQFSVASLLGFAYSSISLALTKHIGYSTVVSLGTALTLVVALTIWLSLGQKEKPALKHVGA